MLSVMVQSIATIIPNSTSFVFAKGNCRIIIVKSAIIDEWSYWDSELAV